MYESISFMRVFFLIGDGNIYCIKKWLKMLTVAVGETELYEDTKN